MERKPDKEMKKYKENSCGKKKCILLFYRKKRYSVPSGGASLFLLRLFGKKVRQIAENPS
jgi:hypothetical protein